MSVRDLYPNGTYEALHGQPATEQFASVAQAIAEFRIGKPHWPDRDPATYDRDAYRKVSLIYRCVTLIAHAAGVAPVRVYDEAKPDAALPAHPLRRLVRQPNPEMGEAIFWANVALRTAVAGFCVIEKERNKLGEVIGLWPLRSEWLKAVPRANARHDWEYRIPNIRDPYKLPSANVVVFRWTDTPNGSPYGIGPIAIALRSAALITKLTDFLGVLMERGGVPMYGLIPDTMPGQTLSQQRVDQMLSAFLRRHGGIENAAIPAILSGIKDVKRLGFDLDELALTDLRDIADLEIVQAFGVPPTKAMIRVGLEHSDSRANAEVDDATFYRDAMLPLWTRFDDALTTSLLPDFKLPGSTISLEFDTSDVAALQPDRNARADWMVRAFAEGGVSQHTMLRELGLPLPATGDFYVRGSTVVAIPAADPLAVPDLPAGAALARLPRVTVREVQSGRGPEIRLAQATYNRTVIAAIAESRLASVARFFREQGDRIADGLKEATRLAAAGEPLIERYLMVDTNWAVEQYRLSEVLNGLYNAAGDTAFATASEQLGVELAWDLANPRVEATLEQLASRPEGVVGITRETQTRVDRIVADGQNDGLGVDGIAANIRTEFEGWGQTRALMIARTESFYSYSLASLFAYDDSAVVDRVQIFDNPNHTTDPGSDGLTCAQRHRLVVPLNRAQIHVDGEHVNGSMALAPVLADDD